MPAKRSDSASHKQALAAKCLGIHPDFQHFLDNLCQDESSGCFAVPEFRLESLPPPYSPLSVFLRISRTPGPGKPSISHKKFEAWIISEEFWDETDLRIYVQYSFFPLSLLNKTKL